MSDVYHLDFETYSEANLKEVGAFKYAEHPSTKILIMAISSGRRGDATAVWSKRYDGSGDDPSQFPAVQWLKEAIETGAQIYAHNAQFEHAICKELLQDTFGIESPAIDQWRCTQAMCRLAAIPSSLAAAGEFLDIDTPKSKEGMRLIQKFSVPKKGVQFHPYEDPEDFALFVDYCRQDVLAERAIHHKLEKHYPLKDWALRSFQADLRMNDRGFPVNLTALRHANTLMEEFLTKMVPIFRSQVAVEGRFLTLPITKQRKAPKDVDTTDGFNPTQGELFKIWLSFEGYTGENLTADTVGDWLTNPRTLTEKGQTALHTFSLIASAAVKKIPAMLNMACEDGYVRGALTVFGAERTHRWTGKGVQPQNFARPRIGYTALAYDMIWGGASLEDIESICGNFFDVLVSVIRHFIQPHEGDFLQADYSSIEARVAPWLVGEQATLDLFEKGEPLYEIMAQKIFGGKLDDITADQRFIGKQAVLGCNYQMGAPKFRSTCEKYGFSPSQEMVEEFKSRMKQAGTLTITGNRIDETYDDLAQRAVTAWREANPVVVNAWGKLGTAAKKAINNPGIIRSFGKLKFLCRKSGSHNALFIKLPSGHNLVYPRVHIGEWEGRSSEIKFWGVIPNTGGKWGLCSTYGGKLLENCTQGTAGDIMRHGMECAEAAGYEASMLVHDETLSPKTSPEQTHEKLCELLCSMAPWMEGLPLAAEGATIPFYKK
tara:strand:+ start:20856 stop:23000 length:2145 start_codon:yes stop_codon:yes gene_type:complete